MSGNLPGSCSLQVPIGVGGYYQMSLMCLVFVGYGKATNGKEEALMCESLKALNDKQVRSEAYRDNY